MKIGIACGGTGGHIFPGLAAAATLRQRGHAVVLWLAGKPGEDLALDGWDGPVVTVHARGISSHAPRELIVTGFSLVRAILECRRTLRRFAPDALLAMGSYASVGPVLAARWLNIPVVLHEANVIPGRAIRFLSRSAAAVAVGFDETRRRLNHRRLVFAGMPVRGGGGQPPENGRPAADGFVLLIMGGSRGAHRLNEVGSQAVLRLHRAGQSLRVIHLTGQEDEQFVRQAYQEAGVPNTVYSFLNDMSAAYRQASLAVCRSGASTCAELAYYGVPALLVPYPFAVYQHQAANAEALSAAGAADICGEEVLTADWLAGYVAGLMRDGARRQRMRSAAFRRVTNDPASALADLVEAVGRRTTDDRRRTPDAGGRNEERRA